MEDIQIHMHVEFTATVSILKFVYTFTDAPHKKIMIVERNVGWGCILNCFMLPTLPC